MSHPVVVLQAEMSVHQAFEIAKERGIHHFPVFRAGHLIGIVCTCDLQDALLTDAVANCVHADIATVSTERTTREALQVMNTRGVGSLLIVDGEQVRGIVTRDDLWMAGANRARHERTECVYCKSHHRLQPGLDGRYVCAECAPRARCNERFEPGFGD